MKIEFEDTEVIEAMKEEFSLNLTGDSYKNSGNKEIIDECVRARFSEFKKVLQLMKLYQMDKTLENILAALK